MAKCDCYREEEIIHWDHMMFTCNTYMHTYCNGTRERDECSCGGDRTKCDFYPEVREKALKEIKPKFGEWVSVKDRRPDIDTRCLVCKKNNITDYCWIEIEYYSDDKNITHWMPLPNLPEGDEVNG